MTIAALLALLDEEHPDVPRPPAPWIPHTAHRRKAPPVLHQPHPAAAAAAANTPPPADPPTTEQLLQWAAGHIDPKLNRLAAEAGTALDTLRTRHTADAELSAIAKEKADLEARLTELRAREGELSPKRTGRTGTTRDYEPGEVRTWARATGHYAPDRGQIPRATLDAWRQAQAAAQ